MCETIGKLYNICRNGSVYCIGLEQTINYQKPVHELFRDVAVEVKNVVKVDGVCWYSTAKYIQLVFQVVSVRQPDIINRQSLGPHWQTVQDVISVRPLSEHNFIRFGVLAAQNDNRGRETSFSTHWRHQSLDICEDFKLMHGS